MKTFFAVWLVALSAASAFSQTPTIRRDASAISFVNSTVRPLSTGINPATTVVATGSSTLPDGSSYTFTATTKGAQFRYESDSSSGQTLLLSNNGDAKLTSPAAHVPAKLGGHTRNLAPLHLPFYVLVSRLDDPKFAFEDQGVSTWNGSTVHVIRCYDATNDLSQAVTQQDWYLDAAAGTPLKVEYHIPASGSGMIFQTARVEYTKYATISGVLTPVSWINYIDDNLASTGQLTNLDTSTSAPDSLFLGGGN